MFEVAGSVETSMNNSKRARAGWWRQIALGVALLTLPLTGALAQRDDTREGVSVGKSSNLSRLVPAQEVENAAAQQYHQLIQQAASKRALAQPDHPQLHMYNCSTLPRTGHPNRCDLSLTQCLRQQEALCN